MARPFLCAHSLAVEYSISRIARRRPDRGDAAGGRTYSTLVIRGALPALAICCSLAGCGGNNSSAPAPASHANTPTEDATDAGRETTPAAGTSDEAPDQSTRWLGDIPYDAFYDRPLEVYRDGKLAVTESSATEPASLPHPGQTVPSPETAPESAASNDSAAPDSTAVRWETVSPIEILAAETKAIRNRLAANLKTVATYNSSIDAIETDGSVLAIIAAIIERHPADLTWKDRAPHVRQLAYDIYLNASGRGRTQFQATKAPFEKIITIWDGGPPPDDDVEQRPSLADAGDRSRVMSRIEQTFEWLRSDVNTSTRMTEELDRVIRETTVMATLGTALVDSSFEGADDEGYRELLEEFIDGHQAMLRAARADDFTQFERARDSVQKSCDACHQQYRLGSSGG